MARVDDLTQEEMQEAEKKYKEWEEARSEEDDAASRAASLAAELEEFGIDPENPPDWI